MEKQKTRVDETVRKGFDICVDNENLKVSSYLIQKIKELFVRDMGVENIEIVPYKLNIYEKGDFFAEHRDTPEDRLIATVVLHITGDYSCMEVDGKKWTE